MEKNETHNGNNDPFLLIPANGGGAVVQRSQIAGARPNGDQGAIVYTKAGPSIYTTLSTKDLGAVLDAQMVEARR